MTIYKNANDTMRVAATEKEGNYLIIIEKEMKMIVATKGSRNPHVESYYTHFEKAFKTKEQANAYFKGIKKNNPTLKKM